MPIYVRKNAWNNQGTFDNPDLLWYAKAVGVMQSRQLSDQTSWWFFAAIHGEYVATNDNLGTLPPADYPYWGKIPGPPTVPISPLPSQALINQYWDQCQHAGWFFPPWHRGYLYKIEDILRKIAVDLGCNYEWALPYWNYFGKPGDQYRMPPAFAQLSLPDGSPNPLFVTARYGPKNDGDIYIPIPPVSLECQKDTNYTGVSPKSYGGGQTNFNHFDRATGALEQNPHNFIHGNVGGKSTTSPYYRGLMSDPGMAALDPIFYLHHSNIDRMWAAWNAAGNANPTDSNWLKGPAATGDRKFFIPNPDGTPWEFTPDMVTAVAQLSYTYDDLALGVPPQLITSLTRRLIKLGVYSAGGLPQKNTDMEPRSELVGANKEALVVKNSGVRTRVQLDPPAWKKVANSLMRASASNIPDEVYLQLENVTGNDDANTLTVALNDQYAGHISLFGLHTASVKDGHHGGAGLILRLDITSIIDELHLNDALTSQPLDVLIQPTNRILETDEITIGRVSIYREAQQ